MSQVKNLRAMFENKGDTSPERGRSSGASTPVQGTSVVSESPRPLSKVRTNFVAIEKDGRIGLQRDPSHESSVSRRRLSMDTDAESVSTVPDKPSASLEDAPRGNKPFFQEDIPESPRLPIDPPKTPTEQMGAVTDEPSVNPDKQIDKEEELPSLLPAEPALVEPAPEEPAPEEPAPEEPAPASPKKENKEKKPEAVSAAPATTNGKPKVGTVKELAPAAIVKAATPKKTTTARPSAISTKAASTKPPAKSPSATKPPTSTTHKPESKPTAKTVPVAKKEPRQASVATSTATRPAATTASKKPQPLKPTTSDTGFVKPKPKSPTKPVQLPASLMAPTAASGAKTGRQAQPISSQNLNVPARPGSRASATGTSASTGKTVKRQPSNVGRPRPSLGPPPKKPSDPTHARKEAPVDEGFLARMMRPTQASSSKTAEKVPTTPPKKTAKRSSSSGTDPSRREFGVKTPGSARKQTRKPVESKPSAGSVASDEAPIIEVVSEEQTPGHTKPERTTEETKADDARKDSKPEPAAAEEAPQEVVESAERESQAQEVVKSPIEEKQESARPITPQPSQEEKSVEVSEITAPEKTETSPQKSPADQPGESVVDSEKPTENSAIVPLADKSSSQPPVVVEETAEASGNEPEQETKREVVPLLEKDSEPKAAKKQTTEIETATENDNMDDVEATNATEEKDTTGQQSEEVKN
ncbi:hypothetical protein EDB82DRAFT_70830 [Fusarium venenatum]|uniref:uncharacterized protein n=1 Tax=Fusarium venenatum TaxID=56646 RepID=UPI001D2446F3|nr:hypothetical protein EDB82DRAFT_70830 [Fusarium venenatum]